MISAILYGRNDNHGYNLHKRAAISLNCIAHVLDDANDEIIFVDYNTPDDMPTFVEAIQDTLTDKARSLVRVLRVRSRIHERFRGKTHLNALEPISRNVALRRSNPANRWMLSTNTDMIFIPARERGSLSRIAGELEDGFYHTPRFELPECLWESFNRLDAGKIIDSVRDWGLRFHLNDVVYMNDTVLYDGPGDFQLALRDDAIAIHGFDEEMIVGWHVDSNFARRMKFHRGEVKPIFPTILGYHCDHTRQATLMHRRNRIENDLGRFFDRVDRPDLPAQKDSWGLGGENVEEISLQAASASQVYVTALEKALPSAAKSYSESYYTTDRWDDLDYDPEHVLPFLCDLFSPVPRHWNVSYAGCRGRTFALFCKAYEAMGFTGRVIVPETFTWLDGAAVQASAVDRKPMDEWLKRADQFIFEFGLSSADGRREGTGGATEDAYNVRLLADHRRLMATRMAFEAMLPSERARMKIQEGRPQPRRVFAVNVVHNAYELLVGRNLNFTHTPFSSRVRHGYVLSRTAEDAHRRSRIRRMAKWLHNLNNTLLSPLAD